jgi:ParB family chromosome partitioning protein
VAKQKFGGLGRGLNSLIPGASEIMAAQQPTSVRDDEASLPQIPVASIIPNPRQPRRVFSDDDPKLRELSASIKEHGLIQPIIVTRLSEIENAQRADAWLSDSQGQTPGPAEWSAKYQIIAGERRWRAAKMAGLTKVTVVIKDVDPQQMFEMALIENIQRADLNPIEEAMAYQALIQDFKLTQEQVAQRVGKDRSTISNAIRLLELPAQLREKLMEQADTFTEGHARALLSVERDEDQLTLMHKIVAEHLSVRQVEEMVKALKQTRSINEAMSSVTAKPQRSAELTDWERDFRNTFMAKVDLKCNNKYKGTLVVHFNNQDELESLYNRLVKREGEQ